MRRICNNHSEEAEQFMKNAIERCGLLNAAWISLKTDQNELTIAEQTHE